MAFNPPIVLMAFANDADNPLRLDEEERIIRVLFADAHDDKRVEFISLGSTNIDDIYQTINRFHRRDLAIFHFGGHSNSEALKLEDKTFRSQSLSKLLGLEPELKLVFLNGCANQKQVQVLQAEGIKVIIATSAPIDDEKALHFSRIFYESLVNGKTIKAAFDTAAFYIKNEDPEAAINCTKMRDFVFHEISTPLFEFPWGLYYEEEEDLNWHLPLPEQLAETVPQARPSSFQLEDTVRQDLPGIASGQRVKALELSSNDQRLEKKGGIFRIEQSTVIGRHPDCDIIILESSVS